MPRILSTPVLKIVATAVVTSVNLFPQSTDLASNPFQPDTPGGSHAASDLRIAGPDPEGGCFRSPA